MALTQNHSSFQWHDWQEVIIYMSNTAVHVLTVEHVLFFILLRLYKQKTTSFFLSGGPILVCLDPDSHLWIRNQYTAHKRTSHLNIYPVLRIRDILSRIRNFPSRIRIVLHLTLGLVCLRGGGRRAAAVRPPPSSSSPQSDSDSE
jgi:hypothetical protein